MEFDREYRLWMESFDTVSDFMINPEHSNKTYEQIFKEFKKSGGKNIGYGAFGLVYYHPKWPYVLKTFKSDDAYLKFVRYAYDNPYPSFPKFYGKPQRVSPKIQSINDKRYLVRIEKLKSISEKAFNRIDIKLSKYFKLIHNPDDIRDDNERVELMNMRPKIHKLSMKIIKLLEGLYFIKRDLDLETDIHDGNIMVRNDGQYVWVDPVMEKGWLEEREDSLMTPETFHVLQQRINKINSKLKNAKIGIEIYDDNTYNITLNQKIDISACGIDNYSEILNFSDEILEVFADDELYFGLEHLAVKNGVLEMDFVTNVGYNNVKFGMLALDEVLDYLEWVNTELKPDLCGLLNDLLGDSINESFQFNKYYRKILKELTSR